MTLKLFVTFSVLLSSFASCRYLTYKIDPTDYENFTHDRYAIELWPDYIPLKDWAVEDKACSFDVLIKFIPFRADRMIDYGARRKHLLPAIDTNYFMRENIQHAFDPIIEYSKTNASSLTCNYDYVWYEAPSRYHAYHGFKMTVYDSYHDSFSTVYAPVPFLRQVDAVYLDPITYREIYVSNDWYYAFDRYGGFLKQGRWAYLWTDFSLSPYVDSVLVTQNRSICRMYNDKMHCTRYDPYTMQSVGLNRPQNFSDAFNGTDEPAFPLKGSFWMRQENQTVLLDSNDLFWVYDFNYQLLRTIPFCEFPEFGKFPCCLKDKEPDTEDYRNSAENLSQFWRSLWQILLF